MALDWQDWHDELLQRSGEEQRPVLLVLNTGWGRCGADFEHAVLNDERVIDALATHAITARVDKDARPELDARYNQGGWPSVVLLDSEGEVLFGDTAPGATVLLEQVQRAALRCRGENPPDDAERAATEALLDETIPPAIERALLADFDDRHGGFGTGEKFPHPDALDYALLRHAESRNARLHEILEKTFSKIAKGGLHDAVDGGFFRYCGRRDWSRPHTEKLLETNAGLARNFLEMGQMQGRADFLAVGERTIDAMLRDFFDADMGLLHSGVDPDDEYYALDAAGRRTRRTPNRSGRMLADGNARAISALLIAGAVLSRTDLTQRAVAVGENLMRKLWRRGKGMYHSHDGQQPQQNCYLRDQAEVARSLLHIVQFTGDARFLAPLEDLIEHIANTFVDANGEFTSRADGQARVGRRDAQILEGAVAAEVFLRASMLLGRPSLSEVATRALEHHAQDFRRYGYAMAAYGRSIELVLHPPLHIVVVGEQGDPVADALLKAASTTYLPSRVVQWLDPAVDAEHLERLGLPTDGRPTAYVFRDRVCAGEHHAPETLPQGLRDANDRRLGR